MYVFGPGKLVASLPGGTPVDIGLAQEITFSTKRTLKELYGQDEYPIAVGAATSKTSVKVKLARFSGLALSQQRRHPRQGHARQSWRQGHVKHP